MISDIYYYKDKPLQKSYNNTYTPPEKIEIVLKLQQVIEKMIAIGKLFYLPFIRPRFEVTNSKHRYLYVAKTSHTRISALLNVIHCVYTYSCTTLKQNVEFPSI